MEPTETALRRVRVAHLRWRLAALDHARAVLAALEAGVPFIDAVSGADLRSTTELPWDAEASPVMVVPPGFSGASVREIGERHAVGELSRDELRSELRRWRRELDAEAGSFDGEVGMLLVEELIDEATYSLLRHESG